MANILGSLFVELGLNMASFQEGMNKASYVASQGGASISASLGSVSAKVGGMSGGFQQFGTAVQGVFAKAGNTVTGFANNVKNAVGGVATTMTGFANSIGPVFGAFAGGLIGGALPELIAKLTQLIKDMVSVVLGFDAANMVQQIENLSEKTGVSRNELIAWQAAATSVGSSLGVFQIGMRRLELAMAGTSTQGKVAKQVLESIGVTTTDASEAILELADAFQKMPDGARKSAIAIQVLGRSGTELIPLLNQGREGIERWGETAQKMGDTISNSDVKATRDFKAATTELGLAWDAVKLAMTPVLDITTKMLQAVSQTIAQLRQPGALNTPPGYAPGAGNMMDYYKLKAEKEIKAAQDAELANATKIYDLAKAQGPVEAKVAELSKQIAEDVKSGLPDRILEAATLEKELHALEPIAALEKQAREEAEKRRAAWEQTLALTRLGAAHNAPPAATRGFQGRGFGAHVPSLLEQAPEIDTEGTFPFPDFKTGLEKPVLDAKTVMQDFSDTFQTGFEKDMETLNNFKDELTELFKKGAIGANVFEESMTKVDDAIKNAQQLQTVANDVARLELDRQTEALGSLTEAWKAFGDSLLVTRGQVQGNFFETLTHGVNGFEESLAKFIVTGRGGFKQVMEEMAEQLIRLGIQMVIAAAKTYILTIALTILDAVGLGGSGLASGIGGLLKLQGGGDVAPGQAYIVGEKRPELFVPSSAGRVYPDLSALGGGGGHTVHVNTTIQAVDAEGFEGLLNKHADVVTRHVSRQLRMVGQRVG